MNKLSKVLLPEIAAMALFLISCGSGNKKDDATTGQQKDAGNSTATVNNLAAGVNAMAAAAANNNNGYEAKMKERRAKGDTLAMPYSDLQKFLPQSVNGYTADKPNGASVNMGKMSYSTADIQFTKQLGGGAVDVVKVSIVDYNQAYNIFSSASAAWAMGISVDSPEEKTNSIKLDNTNGGMETYHKTGKNASITLGVGSRFLVTVEANNQTDASLVESVAKSIDLSKLSAL